MMAGKCVVSSIPVDDILRCTLFQAAQQNDEYSSIAEADALLLLAGDPAGEDEPVRKGTSFQVRVPDRRVFLQGG
jgi:hypothetical protein